MEAVAEKKLTDEKITSLRQLSSEDQKNLSKVLFPDIDTETVSVLGKDRILRPLPLKYARMVNTIVSPLVGELQNEKGDGIKKDYNDPIVSVLKQVGKILNKFYGWGIDVELEDEEKLTVSELQALMTVQVRLNGTNDFLLGPLRYLVMMMQVHEVAAMNLVKLLRNTYTLPQS